VIWDAGGFFLAKHITNNGLRHTNEADQYKGSFHHHLLEQLVHLTDQDAITFMLFARSYQK
jgi:hydroxyethylthiazole kinase-like sugar kinase family protein